MIITQHRLGTVGTRALNEHLGAQLQPEDGLMVPEGLIKWSLADSTFEIYCNQTPGGPPGLVTLHLFQLT